MFNEGPIPPDMIPSIRDLIADLEGYRKNSGKGDTVQNRSEEDLNYLALVLMLSDQEEKVTELEQNLSSTSAAVGFLTLVSLVELACIIYLFVR